MGIELVKLLIARHARDLNQSELVVMGYMCVTALDRQSPTGQPPRLYFGGREALAIPLGYDTFTPAAETRVRRALASLRRQRLIKPLVEHPQTGTRQVYRIEIGLTTGGLIETPYWGSESDSLLGVSISPDRGSQEDPPRTYLGGSDDLQQDESHLPVTELQTARARKTGRR